MLHIITAVVISLVQTYYNTVRTKLTCASKIHNLVFVSVYSVFSSLSFYLADIYQYIFYLYCADGTDTFQYNSTRFPSLSFSFFVVIDASIVPLFFKMEITTV